VKPRPISDQTVGQEHLGGIGGASTRLYTMEGAYTAGGSVGLACGMIGWTGMTETPDLTQAPSVSINGAFLSAERIDQLTDQS
jgi:hypothetical protein